MRHFLNACVLVLATAGCAGPVRYAPAPEVELTTGSLDLAREAGRMVEDRLNQDGDFHPGDLVRLSFPFTPQLNTDQRVQLSGAISPPLLPPLSIRGMSTAQLQAELEARYRPKLARPTVSVALLEYNRPPPPPEIFVLGEVVKPGNFPYRDGTTPFEGIARAGGGNRDADLSRVVVMTPIGDKLVARMLDLSATLNGSTRPLDYLPPYTVLIVPPTGIARDADRSRQIRQIIGFNGINVGSAVTLIQP
ncbi:polysaccharide biosynthesis/export family protein [Sphingomonas radiodurans]|uniref:polysaccharide biosynthesis/export family protein n=1 Tax=Sphingomonas radiodurans TaxID=2890321 RepID=UPI001E4FCC23|nr:SLBB domain-containing protein [Sphingomonas radiodurans]WBH17824.1 SLBB domain-containing protein [Sphingomonas radiodurans]